MKKITLFLVINISVFHVTAQNTWTQKANFGGAARRSAIGFCIGNTGYMGTGYNSNFYDDLWKYDPVSDAWTQVASCPGAARFSAVAFVISNSGYVGTGYDVNNNFNTADFWEYDALSNSWSQSASMPAGQERRYASAFSAQGKGYVCNGAGPGGYLNDLWQYDAIGNSWSQKANFPGAPRYECVGFSIAEFGYIACGAFAGTIYNDFYEYQPQNDLWVQRADYPGAGGDAAAGFSMESRGFIGTGSTQGTYPVDFYEWNQYTDTWSPKANFPAAGRAFGTGFTINNKGYMGMGEGAGYFNDWWEYTPDSLFSSVENIFPNQGEPLVVIHETSLTVISHELTDATVIVTLYNLAGQRATTISVPGTGGTRTVDLSAGIYTYQVSGGVKSFTGKIFVTGK